MTTRGLSAAGALAVVLIASACGGPKTFTVSGTLTLDGADGFSTDAADECAGTSGYDDIANGAVVTINDSTGKKIALGNLGHGYESSDGNECHFNFTITDVPRKGDDEIYSVSISHRGSIDFKESDADDVEVTLGN